MTCSNPYPAHGPGAGFRTLLAISGLLWSGWVLATLPLAGADWMQFRGPHGTGLSEESGLPIDFAPPQHLAWKIPLPGRGVSSPIIVGNRVFVTCVTGPHQDRLHVICFDATNGTKQWERRFWATGRTMTQEKTCVAAPTPVSDGRRIFALFSCNDLVCLDLDGNLLWLRGLTRDYPNASNSLGMASSPVVLQETLIVQLENDSDSFAVGLNAATGGNRWKLQRPKAANWTSPQTLTDPATGHRVVALQSSAGIHAIDPPTGRVVWSYLDGAATIPSSATTDNLLLVPSHGLTALQPLPHSPHPDQRWRSGQLRPATASPLVWQDRVFILNSAGVLTCGDVATGKRLWQSRLKGPFSSSPVVANHHLYCLNEKGLLQVVDLNTPEGTVASSMDLGETMLATPAIAHGAIYFRSAAHLWKYKKLHLP